MTQLIPNFSDSCDQYDAALVDPVGRMHIASVP